MGARSGAPWSQHPADQRPATASTGPSRSAGVPGSSGGQNGSPAATPHPSAVGLCQAYTEGAGTAPGKTLDNPAFTSLIEAAGGKDKVAGYCAAVLAAESKRLKKSKQSGQATPPRGHRPPVQLDSRRRAAGPTPVTTARRF